MKRYIKDNKQVFNLINNKDIKIISIKPIKKFKKCLFGNMYISSYCVNYEKMI